MYQIFYIAIALFYYLSSISLLEAFHVKQLHEQYISFIVPNIYGLNLQDMLDIISFIYLNKFCYIILLNLDYFIDLKKLF